MSAVTFTREDGKTCPGYLTFPAGNKSDVGVVTIQEWWGVNQQILDIASEITSRTGYRTLVPDLYRGKVAIDHEDAGHLMNGLDWAGAVLDIAGAVNYLKSTGCRKVAVLGTCMGGALTLASAALVPSVDAAVCFYGIPSAQLADVSSIKVPVQAHFGTIDELVGFSDPTAVAALETSLKSGKIRHYEIHNYEGYGHAFMNTERHNTPKDVLDLVWQRVSQFLKTWTSVATVLNPAPTFTVESVVGKSFKTISLADLKGKYVVLFFYPLDFTFVCPTEILAFNKHAKDFAAVGAELIGVSVDSVFTHLAWISCPVTEGGLGGSLDFPLAADLTQQMCRDYDVYLASDGHSSRGTFIINTDGILVHASVTSPPVGRNVEEVLRLVKAFQHTDQFGEVCPAGWTQGAPTLKPDPVGKLEYFSTQK